LTLEGKSQHTAKGAIDRKVARGYAMPLQLARAGARVKAFIPNLLDLMAREPSGASRVTGHCAASERSAVAPAVPTTRLSQEAEAALAPLDLPPDGPVDSGATLRARLAPDVAARNFVSWARALDLTGIYSRRSIYALYCEFSEVDERPPIGNTRFLEALAQTEGIAKGELHNGKMRRSWQWTIKPAKVMRAEETTASAAARPEPARRSAQGITLPQPTTPEPLTSLLPPAMLAKPAIVLPRFTTDADHPFSPAGLREGEKSARRFRLNASASHKQRGAVRRAA
jgi:hypothetical protein